MPPHLALEGGEPARGVGVELHDALAGLLQVAAQVAGFLLDVKAQAEIGVALRVELRLGLRDEIRQGRLGATLEGLDGRLQADDAASQFVETDTEGTRVVRRRRVWWDRDSRMPASRP